MGREDEIRIIAYLIWEEEGCTDGHDFDQWLRAEAIWEEKQKNENATTDLNIGQWLQSQRMEMPK